MSKEIILHIGTHKTGSSSLQAWAMDNLEELAAHGVYYPKAGRNPEGNHSALPWSLSGDARAESSVWEDFLNEIENTDHNRLLVVGEEFSFLKSEDVRLAKETLKNHRVRITLSLRPQFDAIRSQYDEWLRQFLTNDSFSTFWRFLAKKDEWFDYTEIVKRWSSFFGSENMTVFSFNESKTQEFGLISTMVDFLQVPIESFTTKTGKNASDCAELVQIWRYLLTKLQVATGERLGVDEFLTDADRIRNCFKLQQVYGPMVLQARDKYLAEFSERSKFIGYDANEFLEVQEVFKDRNEELFSILGKDLWDLTSELKEASTSCHLSADMLKTADGVFDQYMSQIGR